MIGIYKITNKLNNKSYIGQSIHCGKRLDEHCKGNQFIDETIQFEGIENFTFEILKEVNKNELSIWEDFYIIKYNTMYPNGYNKKWNTSEDLRKIILLDQNTEKEKNNIQIDYKDIIITKEEFKAISYNKEHGFLNKICNILELKERYVKEYKEAFERDKINCSLKEETQLSSCQKDLYNWIKKMITAYNSKKITAHLETIWCSDKYGDFIKYQEYDSYQYEFSQNKILIKFPEKKKQKIIPWIKLIEKELIDEQHFSFILNGEKVPLYEISYQKPIKSMIIEIF